MDVKVFGRNKVKMLLIETENGWEWEIHNRLLDSLSTRENFGDAEVYRHAVERLGPGRTNDLLRSELERYGIIINGCREVLCDPNCPIDEIRQMNIWIDMIQDRINYIKECLPGETP